MSMNANVPSPLREEVPGLALVPGFLSGDEERLLVAEIDGAPWSGALRRRVQHHGWRYDCRSRSVGRSDRIGGLPGWAASLARRIQAETPAPDLPDQAIVNEYVGSQGIGEHADSPVFGGCVATVSLLESWHMTFRCRRLGRVREILLPRRSVLVMQGEARHEWTHEIPRRTHEPGQGRERGRRVSLTFRTVDPRRVR